jgi:hypothetical protein
MSRIIEVKFIEHNKVIHVTKLNFTPSFNRGDKITLQRVIPLAGGTYRHDSSEYIIDSIHHILHDWVSPHDEGTDYFLKILVFPA